MRSTMLSPFKSLTAVANLNNQASNLVLLGQHETAANVLKKALSLLMQEILLVKEVSASATRSDSSSAANIMRSTNPFTVEVMVNVTTKTQYPDGSTTLGGTIADPFLFQLPFDLVLVSNSTSTTTSNNPTDEMILLGNCDEKEDEGGEEPTSEEDLFQSMSLAILANMAICQLAHAMKYSAETNRRNSHLQKAIRLYHHATTLFGGRTAGDCRYSTEEQQHTTTGTSSTTRHPIVELVILNNLGFSFSELGDSHQAQCCYEALFQATIRYKTMLSGFSLHHQHQEGRVATTRSETSFFLLVDLFYAFIFAKILGSPTVASAA